MIFTLWLTVYSCVTVKLWKYIRHCVVVEFQPLVVIKIIWRHKGGILTNANQRILIGHLKFNIMFEVPDTWSLHWPGGACDVQVPLKRRRNVIYKTTRSLKETASYSAGMWVQSTMKSTLLHSLFFIKIY